MSRPRLACSTSIAVVCAASVALFAPSARAQQTANGFALNRFDPSERGSQWFVLDGLDFRGALRPAAGLVLDYAHKPLVLYDDNGDEVSALVSRQFFGHVGASLAFAERVRLAFSAPVLLSQAGSDVDVSGVTYEAPSRAAVGDLRFSGDLRLFGRYGDAATGAVGVAVYAPTGSRAQFAGDGGVRVAPRLHLAGTAGLFAWALRAGYQYRGLDQPTGLDVGSELGAAIALGLALDEGRLVLGPEAFGATVLGDNSWKARSTPFEVIFGLHRTFADSFRFGLGVGPGVTQGTGAPKVRVLASLEWTPGVAAPPSDRDGDGVLDGDDACPDTPGVRTRDPRTNGCPPPKDRDGDGVPDKKDACPDVPGLRSADPDKNGCPPPHSDRDGDAILDEDDACPDVSGEANDDPKKNGCPPPPPDRDGDGITDKDDACPNTPGEANDDPKKNGCPPPPPDRDGDGIVDPEDACPDQPGIASDDPKKNGCPAAVIDEKKGQIIILDQVKFKTGSAEILGESEPILSAVHKVLEDHPEITRIRIEGHTDIRGGRAYNQKLSDKRAASVVRWLIDKGIDPERMESHGYGLSKPIATNKTEEGRRNNRRVEFHIVRRQGDGGGK